MLCSLFHSLFHSVLLFIESQSNFRNEHERRYPHVGDDGLSFDSPYETVNVADSNPTVAQQLHTELMSRFTKAFAGC